MSAATLNGHRATTARVNIPAWGCWYASVSIDGEVALEVGTSVTLVLADLTLVGSVLSGGAALGRSSYRIVAGAGGWRRTIPAWSWSDDAGVKFSTAIGDAAREAGETLAAIAPALRTGPAWARDEGQASATLNTLAPAGWYVDEAGVTRLGARAPSTLPANVTRIAPVDRARGKALLASESIGAILPGVDVDGLTAVDVQHETTPEGGMRSTVWGRSVADTMRTLMAAADPDRKFRGSTEYIVDTRSGSRLNLLPLRVSSGMPYLKLVPVRPGVAGCEADVALGSYVVVQFIDDDPSRPYVANHADADADRFQPTALSLFAGGMAGGEHVMTTEACALLIYNTLSTLMLAAGGGPLIAAVLQPLLAAAVLGGLGAQAIPAPPTEAAQVIAAAALQAGFAAGTTPSNAMFAAWTASISLLATKTANDSGSFPSVGCKAVKAG